MLPGRPPPLPLWQPEQRGPNTEDCSCASVGTDAVTFTATAALVASLPAPSRATAVSCCTPVRPAVFHCTEYGAVVSVPITVAPARNCTCATPMLSVALALTVTVPLTSPPVGAVMLTVGGVVSATLATVTATPGELVELPNASKAAAVSVAAPLATPPVAQSTLNGVVVSLPISVVVLPTRTENTMRATPTLSLAIAETATVPLTVAAAAGALSATLVGATMSGAVAPRSMRAYRPFASPLMPAADRK